MRRRPLPYHAHLPRNGRYIRLLRHLPRPWLCPHLLPLSQAFLAGFWACSVWVPQLLRLCQHRHPQHH